METEPKALIAVPSLPLFTPQVTEYLKGITDRMPFWMHHFDFLICIRAAVGEDHHPALWTLAGLMIDFEAQQQGAKERSLSNWYPMTEQDLRELKESDQMKQARAGGVNSNLPTRGKTADSEGLWSRAKANLQADISGVLQVAVSVGDFGFFERWGQACRAVAKHAFGAKHITGKRVWQNGEFLSEFEWSSDCNEPAPKPQAKRRLVIEICTARLNLFTELGRVPTNPETAHFIVEWRTSEKRMNDKETMESLVRTVATTVKRLGLSTAVKSGKP